MAKSGVLIVGASRGLGAGLARTAAARYPNDVIFATSRRLEAAEELQDLRKTSNRIVLVPLDVTDESSFVKARQIIDQHVSSLHAVWISAADYGEPVPIQKLSVDELVSVLRTNIAGPHLCFQHFSPLVLASTAERRGLYVVSSSVGSMGFVPKASPIMKKRFQVDFWPAPQYGISKSGLNMLSRQWADQLEPQGVMVASVHPSATRSPGSTASFTRLGVDAEAGMTDALEPDEAADGIWDAVLSATSQQMAEGMLVKGGKILPW